MTDPTSKAAAEGIEALQSIITERDDLRAQAERTSIDLALLHQRVEWLERALTLTSSERDHYMRFSTELCANLNNIQALICDTQRAAKQGPFRKSLVPEQPELKLVVSQNEEKWLEEFAKKLVPKESV